jgi:hypothetical protein
MTKFWIFTNHKIKGPFEKSELEKLPYFTPSSLICREDELGWWKEANNFIEFSFANRYEYDFTTDKKIKDIDASLLNNILEKTIIEVDKLKSQLKEKEFEIRDEKRKYNEIIDRKNEEIKILNEKINSLKNKIKSLEENSGWEDLYREIKKKLNEKNLRFEKEMAEKNDLIRKEINIRKELIKKLELEKKEIIINKDEMIKIKDEKIRELEKNNYEKELKISELLSINEMLNNKTNDLKKILLEYEKEKLNEIKKFCEELANLKTELGEEKQKNNKLKEDLEKTLIRLREIEEINLVKNNKENEIKEVLYQKITILKEYIQKIISK